MASNLIGVELLPKIKIALDLTIDELQTKLLEIIQEKVYSNEASWYTRTNQFGSEEAWEIEPTVMKGMVVEAVLSHNPSALTHNPDLFQHGNQYVALDDDELANIWNNGESTGYANFAPIPATHFWDEFQDYVDSNFDRIFTGNCASVGLPVAKVVGFASFG